MKNKILKLLEKNPHTFQELKKELNLRNYNDNKKLDFLLKELWAEKKIFYKKSKNTYHIKNDEEVIGTFRETKNGYGFVETDERAYFIPEKFVLNALNNDTVKIILFPLREGEDPERRAGKIVRVMQRNGSAIVGRISVQDGISLFIPDDLVVKHKYEIENINSYLEGDVLLTKFIDFIDGVVKLKVLKKLGNAEDATLDQTIIGYKFELGMEFPSEIDNELNKVANYESSPKRKDITDRLIYTIDGIESKDLDDAIDVIKLKNGNYRLGVHIADVSHYVKRDSIIDREAISRGTSVYLIDVVYPMLPQKLSNDLCSLNPMTRKLTMTCDMEIDQNGKVIKYDIYESEIISKHRLTYEEVDELFNNNVSVIRDDDLTASLLLAKELSKKLREIKLESGMIDFSLPEAKLKLDNSGLVTEIKNKLQTKSEMMIEDLMVVTNETVAKSLTTKKLPGVFRVHPKPKEENLQIFSAISKSLGTFIEKDVSDITSKDLMKFLVDNENNENSEILKRYLIQTMEKAVYSYEDKGHYALGLENYLHFTSPIRRYPDLVVHRLLKEFFLVDNANKNRENAKSYISYLDHIASDTSEKEKLAVSAERKLTDIKKSRYMKSMIGENISGKIVSVVKFGIFVEFENLTQGLVHLDNMKDDEYYFDEAEFSLKGKNNKKTFKLGNKVNVKLLNVDTVRGLIDLEINS